MTEILVEVKIYWKKYISLLELCILFERNTPSVKITYTKMYSPKYIQLRDSVMKSLKYKSFVMCNMNYLWIKIYKYSIWNCENNDFVIWWSFSLNKNFDKKLFLWNKINLNEIFIFA